MENSYYNPDAVEAKGKKKVDRSAAYPARTIEDSLKFVGEIYKNFRQALTDREHIVEMIEGAHPRHIAAAAYYGFLSRDKDKYQVTDFYRNISVISLGVKEKSLLLLKAFEAPTLNKELIEKYDGDEIPEPLVAHLSRFHRITEDAAPLAADVFIKNAKFVGVLDEKNVLNYKAALSRLESPEQPEVIKPPTGNNLNEGKPPIDKGTPDPKTTEQKLLGEMVNEEKVKVRLTGNRFAYLVYPLDLNKKDIIILQKQLEQLELIVD